MIKITVDGKIEEVIGEATREKIVEILGYKEWRIEGQITLNGKRYQLASSPQAYFDSFVNEHASMLCGRIIYGVACGF